MQSHLQAALLGQGCDGNAHVLPLATHQQCHRADLEEDGDEDDFADEECDGEIVSHAGKVTAGNVFGGRTVTLQMLLSAGILQAGPGTMTIEYLGQKFVGDLLEDGKIRSQETDFVFASPSAWAVASKRFINPDKKSGCGWASIRYRGRKLDFYKSAWHRWKEDNKQRECRREEIERNLEEQALAYSTIMAALPQPRVVVKHNTIANRTFTHDANTLIECVPFSNLGKIQPFLVTLSTNAALIMDFHGHLTKSEVCGYLAGQWDIHSHNLQITHAFPCRNTKADRDNAPHVEAEICKAIEKESLILVGWYHSHPFCAAAPTLRDIDAQLDYQIRMKGASDNSYTPCVGVIISPYNYESTTLESSIIAYWVIPPPEAKPNEYGRPMLMSYSVVQDSTLPPVSLDEMKKCVEYYVKEPDFINFMDKYISGTTYIEKLKLTLTSKFPRDQNEAAFWKHIRELVGCSDAEVEKCSPLNIPMVSKSSQLFSNVPLNPNLMMNTDIANLLFNTSKYTNMNSLLGIPDPLAQSTFAANNMFLSPSLFKMHELLKPLSSSSPISSQTNKQKPESKGVALKIPESKASSKYDPSYLSMKNKMEYELNLSKTSDKTEYSASDLSVSSAKHSDISSKIHSFDYSRSSNEFSEPPSKIGRMDFSSLDLSIPTTRTHADTLENIPSDLSITKADDLSYPGSSISASDKDASVSIFPEQ